MLGASAAALALVCILQRAHGSCRRFEIDLSGGDFGRSRNPAFGILGKMGVALSGGRPFVAVKLGADRPDVRFHTGNPTGDLHHERD